MVHVRKRLGRIVELLAAIESEHDSAAADVAAQLDGKRNSQVDNAEG